MSSNKVKGLLKGLRYISQIFDSEKEQEIQIGLPTDVKHVAHIGWDGPSVNSPSWMNEFKSTPGGAASTPLSLTGGDAQSDNSVKWTSDDSRRSSKSARDLPDLPRASRRQTNGTDSPTRERTRPRKSSNKQSNLRDSSSDAGSSNSTQQLNLSSELLQGTGSPAQPSSPRKTRRKKSKENSSSASGSKTRSKAQLSDPTLDFESPRKSGPKSRNKPRSSFEEDEHARETTMIS